MQILFGITRIVPLAPYSLLLLETVRHARLLKRGLFGVDPTLTELHGENEACLVARARARLLIALAKSNAVPSVCGISAVKAGGGEGDGGGDAVLRRVRDAADCILGEVLQVRK